MEATGLGCKLVFSTSCLNPHLSSSQEIFGRHQLVKWTIDGRRVKSSFLNSSGSNAKILPFSRKQVKQRFGTRTFTPVQSVVSSMGTRGEKVSQMSKSITQGGILQDFITKLSTTVSCAVVAGAVLFHLSLPAWAEELRVIFPGSKISEVNTAQLTLVEAWRIVRETYVDSSFNHQDWDRMVLATLSDTMSLTKSEEAYSKIRTMLASLGDPFTRILTSQEYERFRINNDGALEGVGLLIASERDTGRLIVMNPIEGGPAARAGIIPGDEIVRIDDQVLTGLNDDEVATKLRGRAGTSVTLVLRRSVTEIGDPNGRPIEFKLQRETIALSPVLSTVLEHPAHDGRLMKTGYIRLAAFSQNAAAEMERAIALLKQEGVTSYILDLRNNPGGLVKAGLDVAQMWLDGTEVLVNTIDREGHTQPVTLVNGHALASDPLVVLVNQGSASASEIVAGALHDNGRALLLGETTYGKGRIQSVTPLNDGSALFVTVANYLSPDLHQIDHVGITPDLKCSPDYPRSFSKGPSSFPSSEVHQDESNSTVAQMGIRRLQLDPCIMLAEQELDTRMNMTIAS